jgi:hypothetical protein
MAYLENRELISHLTQLPRSINDSSLRTSFPGHLKDYHQYLPSYVREGGIKPLLGSTGRTWDN